MKPVSQKLNVESHKEEYLEIGIPEDWIQTLKNLVIQHCKAKGG